MYIGMHEMLKAMLYNELDDAYVLLQNIPELQPPQAFLTNKNHYIITKFCLNRTGSILVISNTLSKS